MFISIWRKSTEEINTIIYVLGRTLSHNHLIALTNTKQSKSHFAASCLRVKANRLIHSNKLSYFFL